jgi:hypothetical protein
MSNEKNKQPSKPQPTRTVVTPTKVAPPPAEPDGDDDDDSDDGKPSKKLSWRDDKSVRLKRNVSRARWFATVIEANAEDLKLDANLAKTMTIAINEAADIIEKTMTKFVEKIPADFKGRNAPGGRVITGERKGMLKAGQRVALKPDALKSFEGMFTNDELASLEVIALATNGRQVMLKTGTGGRLTIAANKVHNDEKKAA